MNQEREQQLVERLGRAEAWTTSSSLADALGVTRRSIRNYVASINRHSRNHEIIESSPRGYRLNAAAYAVYRESLSAGEAATPRQRLYDLVRTLVDSDDGVDLYELAGELAVSDSTVESDLGRVRRILPEGLGLSRSGSIVALAGGERAKRRLLSRMFHDETEHGVVGLEAIQREFVPDHLSEFKTDLVSALREAGYYVNDFGIDSALLHIAIAVDRTRKAPVAEEAEAVPDDPVARVIAGLTAQHFDVALSGDDLEYLPSLLAVHAITPLLNDAGRSYLDPKIVAVVRSVIEDVGREYLIDLSDDEFINRFALHVRSLLRRASQRAYSRNPLAGSIKTSYPMTYELSVYVARGLQKRLGVTFNDDEIAYIALHIGAYLSERAQAEERVTCTIVCPTYYDLQTTLRNRVQVMLGDVLDVKMLIARTDVDWDHLGTDLVLTTIEPPVPSPSALVIKPFFSPADADRVRGALPRIRTTRRRRAIKENLLAYFDESLFLRDAPLTGADDTIRMLGDRMVAAGAITSQYVEGALERERLSSTVFADGLAVPHALEMSARRTVIAVAINGSSIPWGGKRVNVAAFVAFSSDSRSDFQTFFDQFIAVFSDGSNLRRIVEQATSFQAFIAELTAILDS
ncbi:BglG family transcription antiterminator [Acidipropionibacterium jensenii]|uniref:BglG family transcription antiterminator n=2 Tax=Acidipropionibacterium jensenii TaxID=1749 RepID=UPI00264879A7|nr:BglG family transcription antiterminator [Acidipropionibacterium jensenii]MDN5978335.1 BglG family transcription antiterminator [Acidipropionibacterium jensenii]MDN5995767.1 BglG family transcription antiterminator [Acidipropionibacterium jensenii]MDN6426128.1 BglG family transcription antiterminator [Acidipropionibacterium jensenii]MDN6441460.1 BglG family transcription antiterminator [Acidipropionibacterium jensenii]MDN6479735.1 BglG family transcription antiterminator [Acidipropionibacte